jgi:hypothetical protein
MLVTPYCERDRIDPPHGFAGGVRKQLKTYVRLYVRTCRIGSLTFGEHRRAIMKGLLS